MNVGSSDLPPSIPNHPTFIYHFRHAATISILNFHHLHTLSYPEIQNTVALSSNQTWSVLNTNTFHKNSHSSTIRIQFKNALKRSQNLTNLTNSNLTPQFSQYLINTHNNHIPTKIITIHLLKLKEYFSEKTETQNTKFN